MFKTTAIDTLKQDKKCQACWYMILSTMSGSTTINRFANKSSLDAWENSKESVELRKKVNNFSTRHYASATGLETWFHVPDFVYGFLSPVLELLL